jgi:PAS domain S-box-containing protein
LTRSTYLLLGLTIIVGVLASIMAFAVLKLFAAARQTARDAKAAGAETAFMAAAMEEAVGKLRLEERAMKARAEASERLSEEIVASLTSGLLVVDAEGSVRTLNPAGRRLLDLPDADWTGKYHAVLAGAPALADVITECLAQSRPIVRRTVSRDASSGGAAYMGVTVSPIRESHGRAHGAICLFSDLSDIIELEEQLRLKDSLARLGELTAGIAHEFRNGLATIHGYSRLLDLDQLPEPFRPYVVGIRQETEALGQVVTNFLNFAKPTQLTLTRLGLRTILDRVVDDIRGEVSAHGGTISVAGEFAFVDGDDVLLRQAFANLCRNALEACTDASVKPEILVEGSVDERQGIARIRVIDNGPGIDPVVATRMFRPFFSTKARGTGLGLALVQKIIVTHNGKVAVESSGRGGVIGVTLPLSESGSAHG